MAELDAQTANAIKIPTTANYNNYNRKIHINNDSYWKLFKKCNNILLSLWLIFFCF
jgi:hypothetical protein